MSGYGFRGNYTRCLKSTLVCGKYLYFGRGIMSKIKDHDIPHMFLSRRTREVLPENELYEINVRCIEASPLPPNSRRHSKTKITRRLVKVPDKMIRHAGLNDGRYCIIGKGDRLQIWNENEYKRATGSK